MNATFWIIFLLGVQVGQWMTIWGLVRLMRQDKI